MSTYNLDFPAFGPVKVTKKRGMKSIRLRINPNGEVLVSSPWYVPKELVRNFIQDRAEWISENTTDKTEPLRDGMIFGSGTLLKITDGHSRNHTTQLGYQLRIALKGRYDPANSSQQGYIRKKVMESLLTEAENTLLPRLHELSIQTGHPFNQAFVKRLTSRWGSCDQDKNITLNVFLVQLPPKLQEYVMLHELTHTKFMDHSPAFWRHMDGLMPSVRLYKKILKTHKPRIETK